MSLVFYAQEVEKRKKGRKEKSCGRRVEKQLLKCGKNGEREKESGGERCGSPSQMKLMKIKTDRNQPDLQKKAF